MTTLVDRLKRLFGLTHECSRCGRILHDRKSIKRGMGPECYQMHRKELMGRLSPAARILDESLAAFNSLPAPVHRMDPETGEITKLEEEKEEEGNERTGQDIG